MNKSKTPNDHYLRGEDLEASDAKLARAAYEECLAGDCSHLEARINLGRLMHADGLLHEAEQIYRGTEEPDGLLYFNLGVLLEDSGREEEAMSLYRESIVHEPGLADAHFNLSRLYERAGQPQAAFRHLLAYRRLLRAYEADQAAPSAD
jgi:tetratricopeptide (TPR) repeat protein